MLSINNLKVSVDGKPIINNLNLEVNKGEIHAIMGPNGSGKTTLASVISGKDGYEVDGGNIMFYQQDILELSPEEIARLGMFMSFQYPVEISGISIINFIKIALNEIRISKGEKPLSAKDFLKKIDECCKIISVKKESLHRYLNYNFSGGEKKKNEIFQMAMLEPKLSILDETDSGLDIDALNVVTNGIKKLRTKDNSTVIITHYQRILNHIIPDYVHILYDGKIVKSGDKNLAIQIEEKGYEHFIKR